MFPGKNPSEKIGLATTRIVPTVYWNTDFQTKDWKIYIAMLTGINLQPATLILFKYREFLFPILFSKMKMTLPVRGESCWEKDFKKPLLNYMINSLNLENNHGCN